MICKENNIDRDLLDHATNERFSFLCTDKPRKFNAKNFNEKTV